MDSTYPELNSGYAILSLTRDRMINQTSVVKPYIAIPLRTYGFRNACVNFPNTSRMLLTRPTVFIPCLNRICPITVSRTLKNSSIKSFMPFIVSSHCSFCNFYFTVVVKCFCGFHEMPSLLPLSQLLNTPPPLFLGPIKEVRTGVETKSLSIAGLKRVLKSEP